MSNEAKKTLATTEPRAQESVARQTLIRAFESHIISKVQLEHGQEDDEQAPLTVLRNEDGSPKKIVVATTDAAFADTLREAVGKGVPVGVHVHKRPTDAELQDLARELPAPPSLVALPPPPEPKPKPPLNAIPKVTGAAAVKELPALVSPCRPEHADPKEGIYVRVKSDRNQRLATSPLLPGVNAAIDWAREWNEENDGFPASVEILRDGRVWRRYDRKRSALVVA